MSHDEIIKIKHLSKVYKIYNNPIARIKESLNPFKKRYSKDFYALQDISLTIKKGETIGFIGKNGAGKSTLLKIITGVLAPTNGEIAINGRIASLLELGAGFNPEMSGVENIYMNGMIMGCTKQEINDRIDDIISFADIGDFINQPVKAYSSGMFARVAFAVNAFVSPDILIVDEALSVGDMFFQAKCIDKMKKMMDDGVTVLFVSHDIGAIKSLCKRCVYLSKGRVVFAGDTNTAIEKYFSEKVKEEQEAVVDNKVESRPAKQQLPADDIFIDNKLFLHNAAYQRIQNGKAEFYNIKIVNKDGQSITQIKSGEKICLKIAFIANEDIKELAFAYHIRSTSGVEIVYSDNRLDGRNQISVVQGKKYVIEWEFEAALQAGNYNIACVMSIPIDLAIDKVEFCDFVPCAVQFAVATPVAKSLYGFVHWHNEMNLFQYTQQGIKEEIQ